MDPNIVIEYQDAWDGGVNAALSPKRIGANQAAAGINARFRGCQPHPRCPVYTQNLVFDASADPNYFRNGIYQGGIYYNLPANDYLVMSIGGHIYLLDPVAPNSWKVYDITPDYSNDPNAPIAYLCQADQYVIIQDGTHIPIAVQQGKAFRVGGLNPIPIGTVMAYVNNRLWLVTQGNELLAGDLKNSEDNAVLKFTENIYYNEGGSFTPPHQSFGNIVALVAVATQDTATDQGELLGVCENGIFSVNGLVPRSQWKDVTIQRITLIEIGGTGHRSVCNVNGDLWFLSHDGWRSYRQARAEIAGWNHVPFSTPVRQYVENDTPENRFCSSAVYWDNRLLVTSGPTVSNNRASNAGILSLDFHPVSGGFASNGAPAWDGFWTLPGNVCELLTGVFDSRKRCLSMCIVSGQNALYEIRSSGYADDDATPISWEVDTRKYLFDDPKLALEKTITKGGDIRTSERVGVTSLTLQYRQDDSSQWKDWGQTFNEPGLQGNCSSDGGCVFSLPPAYYSQREILGIPPDTKDPVSNRLDWKFYDMQVKMKVTGWLRIEHLRLQANLPIDKQETPTIA